MPEHDLAEALRAIRPEPTPAFAAELDGRAAAGFPRRQREGASPFARLADWLRTKSLAQTLIPIGGITLIAIVVATAVISTSENPDLLKMDAGSSATSESEAGGAALGGSEPLPVAPPNQSSQPSHPSGGHHASGSAGETVYEVEVPASGVEKAAGGASEAASSEEEADSIEEEPEVAAPAAPHRDIERAAEITLGTKPGEVGDASAQVFQTVHTYNGVVLNSETTNGSGTDAGARFELLIPSGKLDDAMAAFSKIGEVRSRHESTQDITAPTVGTSERLQDSNARIDGLLAQLSEATTESEREVVEAELSHERHHAANLKGSLENLDRRASLSNVELRIESGRGAVSPEEDEGSSWGIGDAFHDAGHLLAIAAGVAIIAFAVLAPLALILFLIWLASRSFTRRARERALA
jgi:hypothetical protein